MPDIKTLTEKLDGLKKEAKAKYAAMESDESKRGEYTEAIDKIIADGQEIQKEIKRLEKLESFDEFLEEPLDRKTSDFQPKGGDGAFSKPAKSWGAMFVESKQFQTATKNPNATSVPEVAVKALYESTSARGGATVFSERRQEIIDRARLQETTLLDIMNVAQTDSNSIEYPVLTGFTNNAAEVVEWDAGGSNYGLKPESDLTFALESAPVQTIAHWIRTSRNLLADAPRLRNTIDVKLVQGLRSRLEGQILSGNGTSPNLRGILNTTGIQTRTMHASTPVGRGQTTGDTRLDTIKRSITDIQLAFGTPDVIVLNPSDIETLTLQKDANNLYMNVFDAVAQRVWNIRVVSNTRIAPLTGLVGDFGMGATLNMREDATVRVSENVADDFIRNAIRILAELRAALTVEYPEMFEKITFI